MNAHNEQQTPLDDLLSATEQEIREFAARSGAARFPSPQSLSGWSRVIASARAAIAAQPSPVVKQNLTTQPAAAQEAVAYLDIGSGGYLDLGSDLPEERLLALPKGRHALGIIGTYGIDGYAAAPVTAAPARVTVRVAGVGSATLEVVDGGIDLPLDTIMSIAARGTPAAPGIDIRVFRKAVLRWKLFSELGVDVESMPMHFRKSPDKYAEDVIEATRLLALIDAGPKGDDVPHRDLVPGVMRCAKCAFQLHRTNLYLGSGTTGPGDSKTEPCPNGCGPLWPVTWQTWATEGWQQAERYFEELRQLQDSPKGGSDPWRGLYAPERAPNRDEYGCFYHPDIPSWDDEREESIAPLLKAQGFDLQCVPGDFSDEAMEEGGERYWQEMREWNPEPEGDGWRLVAIYDTEYGPYSMFVKPLAQAGDAEVQP
ncbi:MAG: hypothetical protein FH747_06580 [Stenotrophomonas sp.]|uniref:hypothetical protein n=1 Tax=Stenotrophomonas sp. TaxID=69392 RepID=UPI001355C69E|nr:hypothetical protein [Stenotrophomonas sp.]MTI73312.1 hypothetical protein [Stenotrophomonas sp.]